MYRECVSVKLFIVKKKYIYIYMKKYIFEFIFHRSKFLSHWVKYWFQLLTLAVFLPMLGVLRTGHPFSF